MTLSISCFPAADLNFLNSEKIRDMKISEGRRKDTQTVKMFAILNSTEICSDFNMKSICVLSSILPIIYG